MSFRILQGNELYKKIEHRDAFRAFSRGFNRSLMGRNTDSLSAFNKTVEKTITTSSHTIDLRKSSRNQTDTNEYPFTRSLTNQQEPTNPTHILHMLSAKLKSNDLQSISKTEPMRIQVEDTIKQVSIGQQLERTLPRSYNNSQAQLFQSKMLRKNNFFKLKSCLFKGQLIYDGPTEQSDFSTLEQRKKSHILRSFRDRSQQKQPYYCQKNNKAQNCREASQPLQTRYNKGLIVSKYSKFVREGLKSTLQQRGKPYRK